MKKENFNKTNYEEDLIKEVKEDFLKRQSERKNFEAIWRLNSNFLMGNQFSSINSLMEVEEYDKQYFWQEREVFNHIAPIIENRLSKLANVRPQMNILPTSSEEKDLKIAKLSKDIIKSVYEKLNLKSIISQAIEWSEITGTSFYKIVWNSDSGKAIYIDGIKKVKEGEVEISVVPPYEIYPESSSCANLDECFSLIHAKAYNVRDIKNIWGVDVEGQEVDTFSLNQVSNLGGLGYKGSVSKVSNSIKHDHAIVIEKYISPTAEYPNGRLIVVCQDKLLFCGDLPYINSFGNKRGFPFIRQVALENIGCFWGTSVIERVIPIQRAYNSVKNRKHEYLNRLSMGVMTVEDGSVDTENLEEEGLSPGKVLIYRQGSTPPKMMETQEIPVEFEKEEEQLLNEFSEISGVSGVMSTTSWNHKLSGTTIQLMVEQDTARLSASLDRIKIAIEQMAKQILRLYKQFALTPRLLAISNTNGGVDVKYWTQSDLSTDDIQFASERENENLSTKQEQILKLLSAGLLADSNGKISESLRIKILEMFGLGVWEGNTDENVLQKNYADNENLKLLSENANHVEVLEIDNHEVHISRHIAFMLDKEYEKEKQTNKNLQQIFLNHIHQHKKFLSTNSILAQD